MKRLLADLLQIRAPKTVEVTHAVISGIFTEANELGYTEVNPAHGLLKRILPSKKKSSRRAGPLQSARSGSISLGRLGKASRPLSLDSGAERSHG